MRAALATTMEFEADIGVSGDGFAILRPRPCRRAGMADVLPCLLDRETRKTVRARRQCNMRVFLHCTNRFQLALFLRISFSSAWGEDAARSLRTGRKSARCPQKTIRGDQKYANRRLYNTGTSTYVTLEDLAEMVKKGEDFTVQDAKTATTSPIRADADHLRAGNQGRPEHAADPFPAPAYRLLRRPDADDRALLPRTVDDRLSKEQERFREQMRGAMGRNPMKS